jgi:hypothetical protein
MIFKPWKKGHGDESPKYPTKQSSELFEIENMKEKADQVGV